MTVLVNVQQPIEEDLQPQTCQAPYAFAEHSAKPLDFFATGSISQVSGVASQSFYILSFNMQLFVKFALVSSIASSFLGTLAAPTNSTLFPRQLAQVITKCTVPNTVALTFDDCIYHPDNVNRIKYLYGKGHQIGSHTWGHKDLTTLTWDQVHDEMWRVEQALMRIIGANPAYMRPPFGKYNDNVLRASAVRGQKVAAASKGRYDDVTARLAILTCDFLRLDILPHAIAKLQAAGYRMVTLSECLGESPAAAYQSQGPPATAPLALGFATIAGAEMLMKWSIHVAQIVATNRLSAIALITIGFFIMTRGPGLKFTIAPV
ncbi:carbohydrate esterase family 4 protein [Rhizoctonia solani AG-1 IA]|uniref:Carbohydrate esterase family 4 protein n=1 Tax=Thanatephorus cucumeris (strain AG1-IA) TaxID=983506 RepID=L8WKC5_THACA|nr:carbohydrate esterase family 4 protein [Rhizoctonia solani AG-1 IA]